MDRAKIILPAKEIMKKLRDYDITSWHHSVDVGLQTADFASVLFGETDQIRIFLAGCLHDVGKMAISERIIKKPGPLDDAERKIMQLHTIYGFQIMKNYPDFDVGVKLTTLQHHESPDGTGYPYNNCTMIDFAKIVKIIDVFEALTHERPYKQPVSEKEALEIMQRDIGTKFDERYFASFIDFVRRRERMKDRDHENNKDMCKEIIR